MGWAKRTARLQSKLSKAKGTGPAVQALKAKFQKSAGKLKVLAKNERKALSKASKAQNKAALAKGKLKKLGRELKRANKKEAKARRKAKEMRKDYPSVLKKKLMKVQYKLKGVKSKAKALPQKLNRMAQKKIGLKVKLRRLKLEMKKTKGKKAQKRLQRRIRRVQRTLRKVSRMTAKKTKDSVKRAIEKRTRKIKELKAKIKKKKALKKPGKVVKKTKKEKKLEGTKTEERRYKHMRMRNAGITGQIWVVKKEFKRLKEDMNKRVTGAKAEDKVLLKKIKAVQKKVREIYAKKDAQVTADRMVNPHLVKMTKHLKRFQTSLEPKNRAMIVPYGKAVKVKAGGG